MGEKLMINAFLQNPIVLELWQYAEVIFFIAIKAFAFIVALILGVAYLTLAERKVIAAMQLRVGPNRVGPFGLLQPIADGIKLLHKEIIVPDSSDKLLFVFAPILTFSLSLAAWAVVPFGPGLVFADINVGILYLFGDFIFRGLRHYYCRLGK